MKMMALSREITLTIDNYNITLDKEIKIYEYDAINLCFTIQEYGIVMRDGKAHNRVMPVVALKAYMLIETPQGVDSVEATNIVRNKVIFSLGNKYSQFVGVGKMQIILRDLDGCRITLPEFNYEVKQSINTGWEMPDVLIGEKDFVITDELGRPVETTKISEMDEVNEVTPQTYAVVINEDGNKKIKLDTIMESISETIEFDVEEIDRRIDGMIDVYDDEEIEVEFPSLHNDVERIKDEINEISESLDTMENRENWVSVFDFGAKCDGVTDDSEALQKAINVINTKTTSKGQWKRVLYIPAVMRIDSPTKIVANFGQFRICGNSLNNSKIVFTHEDGGIVINNTGSDVFEVEINDIKIEGNNVCKAPLTLNKCINLYLNRVQVVKWAKDGYGLNLNSCGLVWFNGLIVDGDVPTDDNNSIRNGMLIDTCSFLKIRGINAYNLNNLFTFKSKCMNFELTSSWIEHVNTIVKVENSVTDLRYMNVDILAH